MKKILAFAGSNSSNSINKQLVEYAATLQEGIDVIDLRDYDAPIYSIDLEQAERHPHSPGQLGTRAGGFVAVF